MSEAMQGIDRSGRPLSCMAFFLWIWIMGQVIAREDATGPAMALEKLKGIH